MENKKAGIPKELKRVAFQEALKMNEEGLRPDYWLIANRKTTQNVKKEQKEEFIKLVQTELVRLRSQKLLGNETVKQPVAKKQTKKKNGLFGGLFS